MMMIVLMMIVHSLNGKSITEIDELLQKSVDEAVAWFRNNKCSVTIHKHYSIWGVYLWRLLLKQYLKEHNISKKYNAIFPLP